MFDLEDIAAFVAVADAGGFGRAGQGLGLSKSMVSRRVARLEGFAFAGVDPKVMGMGPVPATRALNKQLGIDMNAYDLVELNEAFAAQVLACDRELHITREKLNVNGGAIALGHPIGNTGARIVTTLVHELKRRNVKRGLATLCVSGGLGASLALAR